MLELDIPALEDLVRKVDYDPLFVTVSGAHLYGFPSPDSDVNLRGCHRLPLRDLIGLDAPQPPNLAPPSISSQYRWPQLPDRTAERTGSRAWSETSTGSFDNGQASPMPCRTPKIAA